MEDSDEEQRAGGAAGAKDVATLMEGIRQQQAAIQQYEKNDQMIGVLY